MAMNDALELKWYGHSMFTITGGGLTVACDPVPPEVGYRYDPVTADIVLFTHDHYDHGYLQGIDGSPEVLNAGGASRLDGIEIVGLEAFHDTDQGRQRGNIVMFTWEQAGFRLAHLGDLGEQPEPETLKEMQGLDIVMVPVGGVYTIDGEQAVRLVGELAPAIVIPMHYGAPACTIQLEPLSEFTKRFDGPVRNVTDRPLAITRDLLPSSTEVWVLPYQ